MRNWSTPLDEVDLSEDDKRELMCEIGRRCHEMRFTEANGGNISCRLDEERILCTPTLISKGHMTPDDLVVINTDGQVIEGRRQTTSEIRIHLYALAQRPDIQAVVHAHPRSATAFAIARRPLPQGALPEIEFHMGPVPLARFGRAGTPKLVETLEPYIMEATSILLAHHGAMTLGTGLMDAYWKMEVLDAYCDTVLRALALGTIQGVTPEEYEAGECFE